MTVAWLNGTFAPLEDMRIAPSDRGFLLGDGVFETIRVEQGRPFYLQDHLKRLDKSLMKLGFSTGYSHAALEEAMSRLIAKNNLPDPLCALRLTLTRGMGPRGLRPPSPAQAQVLITLAPGPAHLKPAKLCYSTYSLNENSPSSGLKSLSYLDQVIAFEQAQRQGCDEAVFFNTKDTLAEGCMSNIFVVVQDQILTPGLWCGALPGIMREKLLKLDGSVQECDITRAQLDQASEIFLTNSLVKIRPVSQLERRTFHDFSQANRLKKLLDHSEINMIQASTP